MLQFNTTIYTTTARFTRLCRRFTALFSTSSTASESVNTAIKHNDRIASASVMSEKQRAKFNELKTTVYNTLRTETLVASKIQNAQNVHDLLDLIKVPNLSQNEIVKVMSTIINWINVNNANITDVQEQVKNVDSTVCNIQITETENFAQYVDFSTSAMIQEISKLAKNRKRNPKLLKYLFDNIIEYSETLNKGQCSSLLFSMCALCYYDERLLNKISSDLIQKRGESTSNTLHSILKSMAIIRYKNTDFLSHVSKIILDSNGTVENKHVLNILQSFAILGYDTEQTNMIIERYMPLLSTDKFECEDWLNIVWSLLVLNNVSNSHVESVLESNFIKKLMSTDSEKNLPKQLKLLNINGAAKYMLKNYCGVLLNDLEVPHVTVPRTKQKESYVNGLEETLKSIMQPYDFKMNVNTKMGFLLDAECYMDSNFKLVRESNGSKKNLNKIAIMINDFHAYCQGSQDLQGSIKLYNNLLKHSGYCIINISYQHFGIEDKLVKRAQLLKRRLASLK